MTVDSSDPCARGLAAARHLLKDLRSGDPARVAAAVARFARLRSFAGASPLPTERVRLKHALAVVAEEHGYASWRAWRVAAAAEAAAAAAAAAAPPPYHAASLGGFLNRWFADHEEARASREQLGGYLLPFRDQCFVAEAELVRELGLDPDDPDWRAVGFDLVRPRDAAAAARLHSRRRVALANGIAVPAQRARP